MPFKKPAFPDTLKKSEWAKNKDIITELAKGKTGLGKALASVETDFKAIDFDLADTIGKKQFKSPDEPGTKKFVSGWNKLLIDLNQVIAVAKPLAKNLKASKVTPKKTGEYVDSLVADAESLFDRLSKFEGN